MIHIEEIAFLDTFSVRHPILRTGKPIESCYFEGDESPTTKHFGLFVIKKIMGVVSIFQIKNDTFISDNQYQIRGMAVLNEGQKMGYGKLLVEASEQYISCQKCDIIWFNAREKAVGFYERLGYKKDGDPFSIADIGTHYLMFKKIG
jgi:ribosomal protein S18 acetylase RimI-like enzyme